MKTGLILRNKKQKPQEVKVGDIIEFAAISDDYYGEFVAGEYAVVVYEPTFAAYGYKLIFEKSINTNTLPFATWARDWEMIRIVDNIEECPDYLNKYN